MALNTHVFVGAFSGSGGDQLSTPTGVAVDQSSHDVYVTDTANFRVEEFDPSGNFILMFGKEVDQTTGGDVCTAVSGDICQAGTQGTSGGGFAANGGFTTPTFVAVDNSIALSTGDVYVADTGTNVVSRFDSSGNFIFANDGTASGSAFGSLAGISVDASGDLFVYDDSAEMFEFGQDGSFTRDFNSGFGVNPFGIAVDSVGNLYIVRGEPVVEKLNPEGSDLGQVTAEGTSTTGLAIDPSTDDLYVDNGGTVIDHYDSSCTPGGSGCRPADSFGAGHLSSGSGVATDPTSRALYVADSDAGVVDVFGPPPPGPPIIDAASATNLTATSADLSAEINPNQLDTTYHFEYGTSTSFGMSVPVPDGDIGSGATDQSVIVHLTGLQPNTTYHFRVVAQNEKGTTTGRDHTFVYDTASGGLPDGRAYEMVTPAEKAGSEVSPLPATVAPDGSSLAGTSVGAFAGIENAELPSQGGLYYGFTRTGSGWTTTPLQLFRGWQRSIGLGDSVWSPANAGSGVDHLLLRRADSSVGDVGPVWSPALGPDPGSHFNVDGAASEASHGIVFDIRTPGLLWPFDTTVLLESRVSLYEYTGIGNTAPTLVGVSGGAGSTTLVGQCGISLGASQSAFFGSMYNAVSESGQAVFFTADPGSSLSPTPTAIWASTSTCSNSTATGTAPPTYELYARLGGSQTVWVSEPQCTPASACDNISTDPYTTEEASNAAMVIFEGASADGSKVFFTTTQQLTNSDTDSARDLYEYDFNAPVGQRLIQLSAGGSGDATPGVGANVEGVSRISEDGSHVYLVADGVLSTDPNSEGQSAQSGANNLYVYEPDPEHPGQHKTAFIAELCSGPGMSGSVADGQCPSSLNSEPSNNGSNRNDRALWNHGAEGGDSRRPVQATPDGRFLAFTSFGDLTSDDTSTARQVFRYDAQTGKLARISIGQDGFDDNGNAGNGDASIVTPRYNQAEAGWTRGGAIARTMSDDGSYVFFESPIALAPQALDDVAIDSEGNLAQNVYEYHEGHISLISDGRDTSDVPNVSGNGQKSGVLLVGTSASGRDVFFTTVDPLVAQDTDTQVDIYDARIGGGFPAPGSPSACQEDACQGSPSTPPLLGPSSSATFSGLGNLTPPGSTSKAKSLTRSQKLVKALKACKKKPKKKRRTCKSQARKRYGSTSKAKKSERRGK